MNNILEIKGIFKRYDSFILNDISFNLPAGYIMGLVGPNGAGKTTIIKAIVNAINIDDGNIEIFGLDSKRDEIKIKESLGYISDVCYFSENWTAKDVGTIMKRLYRTWNDGKYLDFLSRYTLPKDKMLKEFSSGMKTKLMLATVFSRDTKLLILDEPTSGLDPVMRDEFLTLIKEYIRDGERSVLYSTHITTDLEKTADYITFVHDGRLIFTEEIDTLKERYVLIKDSLDVLDKVKPLCIGFRTNEYGFEALTIRSSLNEIPSSCAQQAANTDEIVVFYSLRGGRLQ